MNQPEMPAPSIASGFWATLKRDLLIAFRHRGELANPLIFFLIVITMIPLGITPEAAVLATLAPGLIWVVALLATLLSLDSLFRSDFDNVQHLFPSQRKHCANSERIHRSEGFWAVHEKIASSRRIVSIFMFCATNEI